jgi:hypothetical protein
MEQVKDRAEVMNEILSYSTGTEAYHRVSPFTKTVITDGVLSVCQRLGAFWLVDAITSYNKQEEVQFWTLTVTDRKAVLSMREDSDQPELARQEIPFTDFPEGEWKFYLMDGVLMLPSEY